MVDVWMPGVERIPVPGKPGGTMEKLADTRKAIVHTSEGTSFENLLSHYDNGGFPPHLSWDPRDGRVAQHMPADHSAYAVLHPKAPETNRYGQLCVQIEVVGFALHPFTNTAPWSALKGWDAIHAWLQSLGIPDEWPAGPPLVYPGSFGEENGNRPLDIWLHASGYFAHSQVPNNLHGDPGAIDITKLTPAGAPPLQLDPGGDMTKEEVQALIAEALAVTNVPGDSTAHAMRWQGYYDWGTNVQVPRKTDAAYMAGWQLGAEQHPRP